MHKNQKGITLITMVITIIIMLILVGVVLFLTVGNNGLIKQSNNAILASRAAQELEEIKFAWSGVQTEYFQKLNKMNSSDIDKEKLKNDLNKYLKDSSGTVIDISGENDVWKLKYQLKAEETFDTFTVDANGNVFLGLLANQITKDDYGKEVNYEVSYKNKSKGGSKWEIFYSDNNYIYLITKGNIEGRELVIDGYNGTDDFLDLTNYPAVKDGWLSNVYKNGNVVYESNYTNMKATEWLLDSGRVWNKLYKDDKTKWVIGAPTLELFIESYNKKTGDSKEILSPTQYGYQNILNEDGILPKGNYLNRGASYWLACPSIEDSKSLLFLMKLDKKIDISDYNNSTCFFRPVVCLNSNIGLVWNEKSKQYDLYSN